MDILKLVTDYYLKSRDFNGYPVRDFKIPKDSVESLIKELVEERKITINFGEVHPNPYIKAFESESVDKQLETIEKLNLQDACLYPSKEHLDQIVDRSKYKRQPFTLLLALGEPQLAYRVFDLRVLENYRNDPRYIYDNDDISGWISVKNKYYESKEIAESDQVVLESFGFAYDSNLNRTVAAYLRYLSNLSPKHQQIWNENILEGNYKLHPDYWKITTGHWPEGISIFTAFLEEVHHINKMNKLMGRCPLFKKEFRERERPKNFGFLIRPTLGEFNNFVHLLDKIIADNIDPRFFKDEVPLVEEVKDANGNIIERKRKRSLRILDEWLNRVKFPDPKPRQEMIEIFKKINQMRQKPAHKVDEDIFDQKYFKDQRELIIEVYKAIRTLRLIFANHPKARNYEIPDWLQTGHIWTY